eukprot:s1411_g12.t1
MNAFNHSPAPSAGCATATCLHPAIPSKGRCSLFCGGEAYLTGAWPGGRKVNICRWIAYIQGDHAGPAKQAPRVSPLLRPALRRLGLLRWMWRQSSSMCRRLDVVANNLFPSNSFAFRELMGS